MSVVIKLENVSKRYRLGNIDRRMLYEEMQRRWARWRGKEDPFRLIHDSKPANAIEQKEIWALKDVNLDFRDGEVVGIIGRNGSGKSTLLKILSKITAPTKGRALLKGRVASLLEVGTGFHAELTGRDNVFMNAAILGMTKEEIAGKFDQIVEFSGVEKFIDTPVKRYSSGMKLRLAFSVAAHVEPEILIMDEVLAVGDAAFQKKCLGRVGEVAREGRTILFVSHQAAAVENLCRRGVVLDNGRVAFDGTQTEALSFYADSAGNFNGVLHDRTDRRGQGDVRVMAIELRNSEGKCVSTVSAGQDIDVYLYYENRTGHPWPELKVYINVKNQYDVPLFVHSNLYTGESFGAELPASGALVCRLRKLPLPKGSYRLDYMVRTHGDSSVLLDQLDAAIDLHVEGGDFFGTGRVPSAAEGACLVDGDWHIIPDATPDAVAPSLVPAQA